MCVLNAWREGRNFLARYTFTGEDSEIQIAVVGRSKASILYLEFDADPGGGGGANSPRLSVFSCEDATAVPVAERDPNRPPFSCKTFRPLEELCE